MFYWFTFPGRCPGRGPSVRPDRSDRDRPRHGDYRHSAGRSQWQIPDPEADERQDGSESQAQQVRVGALAPEVHTDVARNSGQSGHHYGQEPRHARQAAIDPDAMVELSHLSYLVRVDLHIHVHGWTLALAV